jgi:hypothetical protein
MQYHILSKTVEIFSMQQPKAKNGLFEFSGSKSLEEIGLSERFLFEAPDHFALYSSDNKREQIPPKKGVYQTLLALYLKKSIQAGCLISQEAAQ